MSLTAEEREHWESLGFGMGAKVSPTGLSWNDSPSSWKWCGAVGEIVPGSRPKSKGISVSFKHKDYHFPEVLVYHPKNLKLMEPKMPTKPKPALVKPALVKPSAPKAEPSLYKAIRSILESKDRETLHARTQKAVEAVESLLEGVQSVEVVNVTNIVNQSTPAPAVPWSLEGLVVDPGEEAVGQWGFFWDASGRCDPYFSKLKWVFPKGKERSRYVMVDGCEYESFAYIPNFPGAELLKRTTGYEAA